MPKTLKHCNITKDETTVLNSLKNIMEQKCGFHFVGTGPKTRQYALQRQIFAHIAHKNNVRDYHTAQYLQYASHQTVLHSIKLMDGLLSYDKKLQQTTTEILDELEYHKTFGILAQMQ